MAIPLTCWHGSSQPKQRKQSLCMAQSVVLSICGYRGKVIGHLFRHAPSPLLFAQHTVRLTSMWFTALFAHSASKKMFYLPSRKVLLFIISSAENVRIGTWVELYNVWVHEFASMSRYIFCHPAPGHWDLNVEGPGKWPQATSRQCALSP